MDLTLVEGSSWLIKPFCFVFSPKQKWGSTGCWQEGRSINREVAVAFPGENSALVPLLTRPLGWSHPTSAWCGPEVCGAGWG